MKVSSTKGTESNWMSACRRMQIDPYISLWTKLKSKWIKDLNIKPDILKLIEGNRPELTGTRDNFLKRILRTLLYLLQALSNTIYILVLINPKGSCKAQDTVNMTRM